MPRMTSIHEVAVNISKFGNLSLSEFKDALKWESGPTIEIFNGVCGNRVNAHACFKHAMPDFLYINLDMVVDFENASKNSVFKGPRGDVYKVGIALLHELCHWGNYNNVPRVVEGKYEMGTLFHEFTYGSIKGW